MTQLPNIKSSIRSVKTDAERRAKNSAVKSQIRTASLIAGKQANLTLHMGDEKKGLTPVFHALERADIIY